jgi:hypothetical protein
MPEQIRPAKQRIDNPPLQIRQRAQAEAFMPEFEASSHMLFSLLDRDDAIPSPFSPATDPASMVSWESWIFRESTQRTFVFCFFFIRLYGMLKGGACSGGPFSTGPQTWTLTAPLWNAPSAYDFRAAWVGKRRFEVRRMDLAEVLREAEPADVDGFGRMFLVAIMGVDETRGWFAARGGVL